jgi:hypothetical protein
VDNDDPSLLDSVEMGDETWCFQFDPQTKKTKRGMALSPSSPIYNLKKNKNESHVGHFL